MNNYELHMDILSGAITLIALIILVAAVYMVADSWLHKWQQRQDAEIRAERYVAICKACRYEVTGYGKLDAWQKYVNHYAEAHQGRS